MESNSSTDQKNETKSKLRLKRGVKSAPNVKYRTVKNLKTNATGLRRNKQKQLKVVSQKVRNESASPTMISSRPSTGENIRKNNGKRPTTESCSTPETLEFHSDFVQSSLKTSPGKNKASRLNELIEDRQSSSPAPYTRKQGPKPRADLDDRWVAGDKKFKVKEIVNTRIPGRENTADVYQRFEPSMFAYIDTMNNFENEKAVDPFGAKLKAKAWLRQAKERLASGGSDYNPGQSPIIVIEELCAQDEIWDGYESDDQGKDKAKMDNDILENLLEDSDKENVAEEVTKFEWTTPVHETRFEAERCIEQAKTDIAILEQQLVRLGWTREMLNEKEKKRNERRKRNVRSSNEEIREVMIEEDESEVVPEQQRERKHRTIKRQSSIQKILEDHSRKFNRRHRSFSDDKFDMKKKPTMTKRYSTGSTGNTSSSRPRSLKTRTFTIS